MTSARGVKVGNLSPNLRSLSEEQRDKVALCLPVRENKWGENDGTWEDEANSDEALGSRNEV